MNKKKTSWRESGLFQVWQSRNTTRRVTRGLLIGGGLAVILCGIGVPSVMVFRTVIAPSLTFVEQEQQVERVTLFTPQKIVPAGMKIGRATLMRLNWLADQVPPGAVRDPHRILDLYARVDLQPGIPIVSDFLVDTPEKAFEVSTGLRTITIKVDAVTGVEGHAQPGTRVDIIRTAVNSRGELKSNVVAENVRVLSLAGTSRRLNPLFSGQYSLDQQTVTMEVPSQIALQMLSGKGYGRFTLMLRQEEDQGSIQQVAVRDNDITGGDQRVYCPTTPSSRVPMGTVANPHPELLSGPDPLLGPCYR